MTSLFFVILALFVIVFVIMKNEQNRLNLKLAELEKIEELKQAISSLDTTYFKYDPVNKRHELRTNKKEMFKGGGGIEIKSDVRADLVEAGKALRDITKSLNDTSNVKYLIIIEGMAARYMRPKDRWRNSDPDRIDFTYQMSYNRARAIFELWKEEGIEFDEDIFEIILAGSGWFGSGRYNQDMTNIKAEDANKRILLQIIPKMGEIEYHEGTEKNPN